MATEAELAEQLLDQRASRRDVGDAMAVVGLAAVFQALSVVGALCDRGAIDPLAVARWAEFFAANQSTASGEAMREGVAHTLGDFARALREMVAAPPGGSQMR
jgi:hypothetical protein